MTMRSQDTGQPGAAHHPAAKDPTVEKAILHTLAYADIFDYPLTSQEIHAYLIKTAATQENVQAALNNGRLVPHSVSRTQGLYTLGGRETIVETRLRRAKVAAAMWPKARRYGLAIASLPFVRMVAVTGALAMDNVESGDDYDYLIITRPARLWLCRAIIIAFVVKPAARRGDEVCPNFMLSERALVIKDQNLFIAHELAQMVPISGTGVYRRLRDLNPWVDEFLPNARHPLRRARVPPVARRSARSVAEAILRTPIGAGLERWEMARKVRKLSREDAGQTETAFSADWCKGHFDSHGQSIMLGYARRLEEIES